MSDSEKNKQIAETAMQLKALMGKLDYAAMAQALSHSHQLKKEVERKNIGTSEEDPESWTVEILNGEIGQMEQLIRTRAYDNVEGRAYFMSYYTKVLEITKYNEGEDDNETLDC
ncbi:hypothetical protein MHH60_20170 [Paenibacillus sp. FSL H7-0716]|uniref:DUF5082 domain-containing protein n=1 Tax=Paenibacillus odorifer TaxID=189426 RepID=A0AB36J8K3_9BACL|nr:hypothetical protein [Paenibacillus odorifer]OME16530.1 hypothetical protein BSK47_19905 [Paenibacillus odorifer]